MLKLKSSLVSRITGIVLALVFLLAFWASYQAGWRIFIVTSGSMEPSIVPGSIMLTRHQVEYRPGDIITFERRIKNNSHSALITHRVVDLSAEEELTYVTQGDANQQPDLSLVKPNQIIGKTVWTLPWLGHLFIALGSKYGIWLLILFPGLLLVLAQSFFVYQSVATWMAG